MSTGKWYKHSQIEIDVERESVVGESERATEKVRSTSWETPTSTFADSSILHPCVYSVWAFTMINCHTLALTAVDVFRSHGHFARGTDTSSNKRAKDVNHRHKNQWHFYFKIRNKQWNGLAYTWLAFAQRYRSTARYSTHITHSFFLPRNDLIDTFFLFPKSLGFF